MATAIFLTIDIDLSDLPSVLALYDRIQVWRSIDSTTGLDGTYEEITADDPASAVAKSTIAPPWALAAQILTVALDGGDTMTITFAALDPPGTFRIEDVVTQVNAAIPGLASIDAASNAVLDLTGPTKGTGASILLGGIASFVLGFPIDAQNGLGARVLLGQTNTQYKFTDLGGDPSYWYKTRYYSSLTKAVGPFSIPRQGDVTQVIPTDSTTALMALATINLVDVTGAPIVGRRVILVPVQEQTIAYNGGNFGLLPGNDRIELTTNEAGHAEIYLVRGATVRAFFEGSGFSREFVVPSQASFDLLSVLSTASDPFSIVQAPPMPIRES